MTEYKRYRFKKLLRRYWAAFLGTGLFAIIGGVFMLIGFQMTGWSLIDWLKSPYAVTCGILFAGGALLLAWALITAKRHSLGD